MELAHVVLEAVSVLEEMEPAVEVPVGYSDALDLWMQGLSTNILRQRMLTLFPEVESQDEMSIENFGRWVGDFFSYRLPWGIAGYLRVATDTLELAPDDVSSFARALPSMVKFGVSLPEAAWAMSSGIPFRQLAMRLATDYHAQQGTDVVPTSFRDWLEGLEETDLRERYNLEGDVLQDVAAALSRAAPSNLLRDFHPLNEVLPLRVTLRGISPEVFASAEGFLLVGGRLTLGRDYDNTIDRNSILVIAGTGVLGTVPRRIATFLAPEMDSGANLQATIIEIRPQTSGLVIEITATTEG